MEQLLNLKKATASQPADVVASRAGGAQTLPRPQEGASQPSGAQKHTFSTEASKHGEGGAEGVCVEGPLPPTTTARRGSAKY